jgi:hypothetical protein
LTEKSPPIGEWPVIVVPFGEMEIENKSIVPTSFPAHRWRTRRLALPATL